MRLRALLFVLIALGGAGAGARWIAVTAAGHVERTSARQAAEALGAAGENWTRIKPDGLTLTLTGEAPDESSRLRAAEILRRVVDPRRVLDETTLAAADPLAPPSFALELLRDGGEVSLIGLAPEAAGRELIAAALADNRLNGAAGDMLETVAHPPPKGWEEALSFGLDALGDLPHARISVKPGHVAVAALAAGEAEGRSMEAALGEALPDGVALALQVDAPRPMIDPFQVEFVLAGGVGRLAACAAETDADAAAIAAAAGAPESDCVVGLGAPSPDWAEAARAGIKATRALGGGRFAMSGHDAHLSAPASLEPERVRETTKALGAQLPATVSLTVITPPEEQAAAGVTVYAPRFNGRLLSDGTVRLAGPVRDAPSREAIGSFAAALFGHDRVVNATVLDPNLPQGWPGRVLTGVEALSMMKEGRLEVTPEIVAVEGEAAHAKAEAQTAALFAEKDLGRTRIALSFDAAPATPPAQAAAVADPVGACTTALAAAQAVRSVAFEPGSATLEASGEEAVAAIAAALGGCPPLDLEIAGHTDSQGRAEFNKRLSEDRAATVKAALESAGVRHLRLTARGYGAERPVAQNDTDEGRARNRRIEFTLVGPASDGAAPRPSAQANATTTPSGEGEGEAEGESN